MAIIARTQSDVYNTLLSQMTSAGLVVTTDVTLTGLVDVFSARLSELYTNQDSILNAFRLTTAAGTSLDILANDKGITRYRSNSISDLSTTNFKFYLPIGKVGADYALDMNLPLVIPAGQQISGGDWTFITTESAIIMPDANSGYCGIQAIVRINADVIVNSLLTHSVSLPSIGNIDMTKSPQIMCKNDRTIVVQPIVETDAALRMRVLNRVNSMNNSNNDAILLALKAIGISEVNFRQDMFGIGTVGIELLTGGSILSNEMLDAADNVIKRISPYARVIRPEYMAVQMCFSIQLNNYDNKDSTTGEIISNIYNYFDGLTMGSTLNVSTLLSLASIVTNVKTVKLATMMIDGRRVAITNQIASPTEQFVALENSIDFTV
jgi:uncharacterized phage protein gp47/JayE